MTAAIALSSVERAYDQGRQWFEHIVGYLDSKETSGMTYSKLERALEKKGRELMRMLLQEHLNNRGPGQCDDPPVQGADGVERLRVRLQERELETVFGTVSVDAAGYGRQGECVEAPRAGGCLGTRYHSKGLKTSYGYLSIWR